MGNDLSLLIEMDGATWTSGTSLTSALLIYPNDRWGLEFRPTWAYLAKYTTIKDYDLALHIKHGVAGIKLGYRWVKSPFVSLDGPYAGLVFRW